MSEPTDQKIVHIHRYEARNIMGIKHITVHPVKVGVTKIGGANGSGKSSSINSLFWAFGGKPPEEMPIRKGQTEAIVEVDLSDGLYCKRRFWIDDKGETKTELQFGRKDDTGFQKYTSPQSTLDRLMSKMPDPFEFSRLPAKEQIEMLKGLLKIDTSAIDNKKAEAFEDRKMVKKELAALEAKTRDLPEYPDAPTEELSAADLSAKLTAAHEHNAAVVEAGRQVEIAQHRVVAAKEVIDRKEGEVKELEARIDALKAELPAMREKLQEFVNMEASKASEAKTLKTVDIEELDNQFESLETVNRQVRSNKAKADARAEWKTAEAKRVALQKVIDDMDMLKKKCLSEAVASAKLPVDDLDINEEDGTMSIAGIPFSQVNTAKVMEICVALAVHGQPTLRIFRIDEGSNLDRATMASIQKLGEKYYAQFLVEVVSELEDIKNGAQGPDVFLIEGEAVDLVGDGRGRNLTREETIL